MGGVGLKQASEIFVRSDVPIPIRELEGIARATCRLVGTWNSNVEQKIASCGSQSTMAIPGWPEQLEVWEQRGMEHDRGRTRRGSLLYRIVKHTKPSLPLRPPVRDTDRCRHWAGCKIRWWEERIKEPRALALCRARIDDGTHQDRDSGRRVLVGGQREGESGRQTECR
jgi:hypothetical protein